MTEQTIFLALDDHLAKLAEIRDAATAAGDHAPAATAEIARGWAAGLRIERSVNTNYLQTSIAAAHWPGAVGSHGEH